MFIKNISFYMWVSNKARLDFFLLSSCLQKSIRRWMLDDALFYAREFLEAWQINYLFKRLLVILVEDIWVSNIYLWKYLLEKIKEFESKRNGEIRNSNEWFWNLNIVFEILKKYNICNNNVYIWMEATWSYHFSLLQYLNNYSEYKNTYVINPSKIKQFKRWYKSNPIKTDKDDSIYVAKYMLSYKQYFQTDENADKNIKSDIFSENKTSVINRSEYLEVSNLRFLYRQLYSEKKEYSKMELYIKSNLTKEEIIKMSIDDFFKNVMDWTWNKERNNKNHKIKLEKLQNLFKKSIWLEDVKWIYQRQMKLLVDKYYFYEKNIINIEQMISDELDDRELFIPEIYGVTKVTLWIFYSEMGSNIFHKNLKELIWFIGWYPVEISSWWKSLAKARLQTKWNYMLRRATYLIIYSLLSHVPEINKYKEYLMKKKNIKAKQAMVESGTKILRMILSLFKNKQNYNPALLKLNLES